MKTDKKSVYVPESATESRRMLLHALVRAVGTAVLLLMLYFVIPLDGPMGVSAAVVLTLSLPAFGMLVVLQVRSILRAKYPAVRAVQALAATIPLLILIFASTYFMLAHDQANSFNQSLTRVDALYFTVTAFATVGFGDIVPVTQPARVIVTFQMTVDLLVLSIGLKMLFGVVQMGRERQAQPKTNDVLRRDDG